MANVENTILLNDPGYEFRYALVFGHAEERSYGVSIGELNGNGYPELVFANSDCLSYVYPNATQKNAEAILTGCSEYETSPLSAGMREILITSGRRNPISRMMLAGK